MDLNNTHYCDPKGLLALRKAISIEAEISNWDLNWDQVHIKACTSHNSKIINGIHNHNVSKDISSSCSFDNKIQ